MRPNELGGDQEALAARVDDAARAFVLMPADAAYAFTLVEPVAPAGRPAFRRLVAAAARRYGLRAVIEEEDWVTVRFERGT